MQFTDQQETALKKVSSWLKNRDEPVFRLFGYAGTGKSTIAKQLSSDFNPGEVFYLSPTGKAADVLRRKGCPNATTIHSKLYFARDKSRKRLLELEARFVLANSPWEKKAIEKQIKLLKLKLQQPNFILRDDSILATAKLLIVDEAPMIDMKVGADLCSLGVPILALGDPAQLPPIFGKGFFTTHSPDVVLTDIQRQSKDNPIIYLSTVVREGGSLKIGSYGDSKVIRSEPLPQNHLNDDVLSDSNVSKRVLVGMNDVRKLINSHSRDKRSIYPVEGEEVMCLRNNQDKGLYNGGIYTIIECEDYTPESLIIKVRDDEGDLYLCEVPKDPFIGKDGFQGYDTDLFCYCSAITVHKSQGSQFNNVLLIDQSKSFGEDAKNHLYTGITRASDRITIAI